MATVEGHVSGVCLQDLNSLRNGIANCASDDG
jgi:hypothetical protein